MITKDRVNAYNNLLQGFIFIAVGILFVTRWKVLWAITHLILTGAFIYLGVSQFVSELVKKKKLNLRFAISIAANGIVVVYAISNPMNFLTFVPYMIGWYALLNGVVQSINFYVYRRDFMRGKSWRLVLAIINLTVALVLILSPAGKLAVLSATAGIYLCFHGTVTFYEALMDVLSPKIKHRLRRRMSLSVPMIVSAIIPSRVFTSIDALAKTNKLSLNSLVNTTSDLEVFIYLSKSGPESLGHVDISFEGKIYSYGCHDPLHRRLFGTLGDGVLIVADREQFLAHALAAENKTIISYDVVLSTQQKQVIQQRLDEMLSRSEPWESALQREGFSSQVNDYASRVYRDTQAEMYKFKKGKFKTYFVFSTNCVLLADHILRCPQLDLFNITGIVTPGSYLSFLNDEYCRQDSIVTTRTIYKAAQ